MRVQEEEMKMSIYKREFSFPSRSNKNEKDDDENGDRNVMRCQRRVSNQLRHSKVSGRKKKNAHICIYIISTFIFYICITEKFHFSYFKKK